MRRVVSVALALTLGVFILTACAPEAPEATDNTEPSTNSYGVGDVREQWVKTPRGDVYCVSNKNGYSGGMTCDWDHPRTTGAR